MTSARALRRPAFQRELLGAGIALLFIGGFALLAGCYRMAVESSGGKLQALVPLAVDAPLSGELFVLLGVVLAAAAVLLLGASRRRSSSTTS